MRTPLYSIHRELKGKFINFNGWELPVEYSSIREEALAVRNSCGIFDVSHMGRLVLKDSDPLGVLNYLTTNDVKKLYPGRVQYNLLTNENGGILDDITVYMLSKEEILLCVNASNRDKVKRHLEKYLKVEDISEGTVQIAIQGRTAKDLLSKYFNVNDVKYYHFRVFDDVIVSRTGYTGEDGFEVYAPISKGIELFKALSTQAKPCGLGARDLLRIEAGFALYGHEIGEDITPIEANLEKFVDMDKDFLGKSEMLKKEVKRRLFGLELSERGVPRKSYKLLYKGLEVGYVSSGTYSYCLGKGIALCFMDLEDRMEGLEV